MESEKRTFPSVNIRYHQYSFPFISCLFIGVEKQKREINRKEFIFFHPSLFFFLVLHSWSETKRFSVDFSHIIVSSWMIAFLTTKVNIECLRKKFIKQLPEGSSCVWVENVAKPRKITDKFIRLIIQQRYKSRFCPPTTAYSHS